MTEGPLLYKFQLQDVRKIATFGGRCLVAWDTGLGKGVIAPEYLRRNPGLRPAVIVTQAGLKKQWERELWEKFGLRCTILEGTRPPSDDSPVPPSIVVASYNIVGPSRIGPGWLTWLKSLRPQVVVFDEAQALAGMYTTQTKNARKLAKDVPQVLMTTGTPITNRPIDLFPLINILWPREFPNYHSYGMRYCSPRRVPWGCGWEYKGASHLPELHAKLIRLGMLRRRKDDVLALPEYQRNILSLPLSDAAEYAAAEKDFLTWLAKRDPSRLSSAEKAERLVRFSYLRQLAASLKLPSALEWVQNHLDGCDDKIILYAIHKDVIARIRDQYAKKCVVIDGSVAVSKRQKIVDSFLGNGDIRILVGNIKAAGAGWSAPGVPDMAFLEYPWKPSDLAQCEGRIRGIKRGKKGSSSNYHYLVAENTIEKYLIEILQQKQETCDAVIDGGRVRERFNIFDLLTNRLKKRSNK